MVTNEVNYYFTSIGDDGEKFTRSDDYRIYSKNI